MDQFIHKISWPSHNGMTFYEYFKVLWHPNIPACKIFSYFVPYHFQILNTRKKGSWTQKITTGTTTTTAITTTKPKITIKSKMKHGTASGS